jgi:hypothetical protein
MLEGEKILYRYGFALLEIYKREIKEGRFQSGVELWAYIKENAGKLDYEYLSDVAFDRYVMTVLDNNYNLMCQFSLYV